MIPIECGVAVNMTSSTDVSAVPGILLGFYVNSTSSGTVIVKDGGTSGTALSGTITPAVGFHRFPAQITTSCYFTVGGTLNVTAFFIPTPTS